MGKMSIAGTIFGMLILSAVAADSVFENIVYYNKGETFTLPCKNQTRGRLFGVVWQKNGNTYRHSIFAYTQDTGYHVEESIDGRSQLLRRTNLQIEHARPSDTGQYRCNLIYIPSQGEPGAQLMSNISVVVFAAPNITSLTPTSLLVRTGHRATVTCSITASPSANIAWSRRDGKLIRGRVISSEFRSILKFKRLRASDTGFYTCKAENRAGTAEKSFYLKVKTHPRITLPVDVPHFNVDTNGKITCKATGYPLPRIEWQISLTNGNKFFLKSGQSYNDAEYSVSSTDIDHKAETSENSLEIHSVTADDWKNNYTCIAENSEGSDIKLVKIVGYDKPGSPTIVMVTTSTDTSTIHWKEPSKDGGSEILSYIVQYKNASQNQWATRIINTAASNVDRYQITNLRPNTMYKFRIYARNAVGMSQPSKEYTMGTHKMNSPTELSNKPLTPTKSASKNGITENYGITALIGIVAGVFLLVLLACVAIFFLYRKVQKTAQNQSASVVGSRPVSIENGSLAPHDSRRPSAMPSETGEMIPLMIRVDQWEFPRDRLRLSTVLGAGAFGKVMRGDAQGIRGSIGTVKCAVKMVKDTDNENAKKDLYAELDLLKLLPQHPNVVSLLGCCTRAEPLMIIVEYCAHGDLQGFLRNSRGITERYYRVTYECATPKLTSTVLLTFAWQIAKGMSHLAAFKVIHRDLAARNILVDENLVCKISDFGFARDIYVEDQYIKKNQGGRFPIKWMAIESLIDRISTSKSDVWSFGVVLWEIITLGASPYPGMNAYEIVSFLQDGHRLEKPKHSSDELYSISMDCWHAAPARRPTFEELAVRLKELMDSGDKEFINMNFYQDHLYENFDVNFTSQSSNNAGSQELTVTESTPLATGFS